MSILAASILVAMSASFMDRLVRRDRLAEGLALPRVAQEASSAAVAIPAAGRDVDAAELDPFHEPGETSAEPGFAAEDGRRRRPKTVEGELVELDALVPQLLELGDREAGDVGRARELSTKTPSSPGAGSRDRCGRAGRRARSAGVRDPSSGRRSPSRRPRGVRSSGSPGRRSPRAAPSSSRRPAIRRLPCAGAGARCSSVPCVAIIAAVIRCVLRTPESDIQPRELDLDRRVHVVTSRPRPPCSSGIVIPNRPSSRIRSTSGPGKTSSWSKAGACGTTSMRRTRAPARRSRAAPASGRARSPHPPRRVRGGERRPSLRRAPAQHHERHQVLGPTSSR